MFETLPAWLGREHPKIWMELGTGIIEGDPEREAALRSPDGMEKWLERQYPDVYEQWRTSASREP